MLEILFREVLNWPKLYLLSLWELMSPFSLRDETALRHSHDTTKCAPRENDERARNIGAQVKVYYVQPTSFRREELSAEHYVNKSSSKKTKFNE